jgi:hypothetical protein
MCVRRVFDFRSTASFAGAPEVFDSRIGHVDDQAVRYDREKIAFESGAGESIAIATDGCFAAPDLCVSPLPDVAAAATA